METVLHFQQQWQHREVYMIGLRQFLFSDRLDYSSLFLLLSSLEVCVSDIVDVIANTQRYSLKAAEAAAVG